jgi:predicted O-linked N-acetylglucosamine transferase (SPINDLY family)
VTFAGFGSHLKMNNESLALWAQVLGAVPGSRLLVKCPAGRDPEWVERFLAKMGHWGIEAGRIEVMGWQGSAEHWQVYDRVDISLDTYPYGGCLTTLEGLCMGVPTVSLAGDRYTSRAGLTLLSRVGLAGLVASDPDGFILRAVSLARDPNTLARIRGALRRRLLASGLCEAGRYARELETAYRRMWRTWCARRQQALDPGARVGSSLAQAGSEGGRACP